MTRPSGYLIRMLVFLVAVGIVAALLSPVLITAFDNNPVLNSLILLILLLGIGWNLNQVLRLRPEVDWLETYQTARARLAALPAPKLLAPMASMLAMREGRDQGRGFTLSATGMRSLLDGISSRLDESRELSRYMTSLLIFLGLLGTFWGLLKTVTSVSDVIGGMSLGNGDMNLMFDQLKSGLARPLAGMGTAFSASMYGLAGALVLGFLDLTAGQAQNRFFNELEEWLAGLTRLSSGALSDGEGSVSISIWPANCSARLRSEAETWISAWMVKSSCGWVWMTISPKLCSTRTPWFGRRVNVLSKLRVYSSRAIPWRESANPKKTILVAFIIC